MSGSITKYFQASIDVPIREPLDVFADRLGQLMPGFVFEETDRYDEVPAYEAKHQDMKFVLFGVPADEIGDYSNQYELQFDCRTDLPIEDLLTRDSSGLVRRFIHEKAANERGLMDFSEELAALLVELGIPGCQPIRPVTN
ncbi:hypothetical protein J2W27_004540 [Variovorax boronicumulans]|uniref:hypothetical protein n=1 Tax=Variovorax boronicumulans TaxID=436515 RepID=UPI002781262E|nr:hypothetical protein [Variovorax boronicumulans]MDP9912414.1 hypothetical protein [Variovorax boronicumulans]